MSDARESQAREDGGERERQGFSDATADADALLVRARETEERSVSTVSAFACSVCIPWHTRLTCR